MFSSLGALAGGGIGLGLGGPAGAAAGLGFGGGIGGLMDGSPSYTAPTFSDINLQTTNPALYAQLMKESAAADQAMQLYNQRRQGPTYAEQQNIAQNMNSAYGRQAQMGQLGSAVGASQGADAEAQLRGQLAQKAFSEQQQLLAQATQSQRQYTSDYSAAQQGSLAPLTQQAQYNYQGALQNEQGQNQFMSGLVNGGLSLYGNQQNTAALQGLQGGMAAPNMFAGANPYTPSYSSGVPTYSSQPQYSLGNYNYGGR